MTGREVTKARSASARTCSSTLPSGRTSDSLKQSASTRSTKEIRPGTRAVAIFWYLRRVFFCVRFQPTNRPSQPPTYVHNATASGHCTPTTWRMAPRGVSPNELERQQAAATTVMMAVRGWCGVMALTLATSSTLQRTSHCRAIVRCDVWNQTPLQTTISAMID